MPADTMLSAAETRTVRSRWDLEYGLGYCWTEQELAILKARLFDLAMEREYTEVERVLAEEDEPLLIPISKKRSTYESIIHMFSK